MSDRPDSVGDRPDSVGDRPDPEPDWKRRQRLAEVFGDVLPDTTGDERDPDPSPARDDQWLRDQVPPHHGG